VWLTAATGDIAGAVMVLLDDGNPYVYGAGLTDEAGRFLVLHTWPTASAQRWLSSTLRE